MSPSDEATKLAMIDDIEQMDMIIGRFLDYARPMQRMPEAVDLSMIASELAARFQADEGVVMRTDLAPGAVIEGDPTDARRVVGNLLENARKYGRSERDDIARITLQTRVAHGRVELSVMDEGLGIPDDQVALITRPFYRVDAARTQANCTGLGMAIVQRLVTRQRGALRLRNRTPLPGFEVTIDFPQMKGARFDGPRD